MQATFDVLLNTFELTPDCVVFTVNSSKAFHTTEKCDLQL